MISQNPSLAKLTISDLYSPEIDTLTKKIDKNHLLNDIIFPFYHFKKVAFLCITPQILKIYGNLKPCSRQALTFDRQPQIMTLNGTIVLNNLKNKPGNHLSKQIIWAFSSLEPEYHPNSLFSQNISQQHTIDKIQNYFKIIDNIELGFFSATGVLTLTLIILILLLLFCFFPKSLQILCCCKQKSNLIAKML